ncbi:unnamed protein product [Hydatigera taeniaeformis]|uniref:DUF1731 domain-containing protein n=1 Tax=Hydatigena taeniaeformis TaxID=6205 RepID=A0A0R3WIJ3_HYDTA|nr:unnamed protein product [Hydatigera taeniaeformis]
MSTSAKLNIVIGGGTGLIGKALTSKLLSRNASVRIITRNPRHNKDMSWETVESCGLPEDTDVIINLAGRYVGEVSPGLLIPSVDNGFLARLVREWETACSSTRLEGVKRVLVRIGVVLSKDGGFLSRLYQTHRLGLGGPIGSGQQWISWIHIDDLVNLFCFLIMSPAGKHLSDAVNATAPYPVRQGAFSHALSESLSAPFAGGHIFTPAFMVRAIMGRERAPLLLEGQRVLPAKAQEAGFKFNYPTLELALENIYGKRPRPVSTY